MYTNCIQTTIIQSICCLDWSHRALSRTVKVRQTEHRQTMSVIYMARLTLGVMVGVFGGNHALLIIISSRIFILSVLSWKTFCEFYSYKNVNFKIYSVLYYRCYHERHFVNFIVTKIWTLRYISVVCGQGVITDSIY